MIGTSGSFGKLLDPRNSVPRVQERSECSGRAERAEQFSKHSWASPEHVAKISMLRLNISSGKLSSCMLSIGRGPKAVQGKGGGCLHLPCSHLGPRPMLSMHELSLPEPMLSLSMLILATRLEHAQECSEHCSERSARSERLESH